MRVESSRLVCLAREFWLAEGTAAGGGGGGARGWTIGGIGGGAAGGALRVSLGILNSIVLHSGILIGSPVSIMLLSHCEEEFL